MRHVETSGGFFTNNLVTKIRDAPKDIKEVQWPTFGPEPQKEHERYKETWEWVKLTYDEIAKNIDGFDAKQRYEKWIKPMFQKLNITLEPRKAIDVGSLSEEKRESVLTKIVISHQVKEHPTLAVHIVAEEGFDETVPANYQKKSHHDHLQRSLLLQQGMTWGFLTNGKQVRLLGQFSNIYAKGYVEFDLDGIIVERDEPEFRVFYCFLHESRFDDTFSLDPTMWINKMKKQWEDAQKKRVQGEPVVIDGNKNDHENTIDESSSDKDIETEDEDLDEKSSDESDQAPSEAESEEIEDESDSSKPAIDVLDERVMAITLQAIDSLVKRVKVRGTSSVSGKDSEEYIKILAKGSLDVGSFGRDFLLKQFEAIIKEINENKTILKRMQDLSQSQGIEIGKELRKNVREALQSLGEGLIQSDLAFAQAILGGKIDIRAFFQDLLRIIYRIIFVLYAEAQKLLPDENSPYYDILSLTALKKIAEKTIRDDQNTDLWNRLFLLFNFLNNGELSLGINAFGGDLFDNENLKIILDSKFHLSITNSTFLYAIQKLTIAEIDVGWLPISYKEDEMGAEEIGSIYESLLDFQPEYVQKDSPTYHFVLNEINTERKGSGTYYTPKGLINILLNTALKPVVEKNLEKLKTKEEKISCLLDLKVCDPACGSGSFLLASIDYLGKNLAQIQAGYEAPDLDVLRECRRKVLQHCIYGVDLNPMALELAKVSLWLKAAVKDKPLNFLDSHLKVGNSLIGFTREQESLNINSKSFNFVKGEAKTGIPDENKELKKLIQEKLKVFSQKSKMAKGKPQQTLFSYADSKKFSRTAESVYEMDENTIEQLKTKKSCYLKLKASNSWKNLNLQANLWTASYFWRTDDGFISEIPTDDILWKVKQERIDDQDKTVTETNNLTKEYNFFNWYMEFPEVFQRNNPGFNCVLMNPPWDILRLNQMEFFANRDESVCRTQNKSLREKQILQLKEENKKIHSEYVQEYQKIKKMGYYFKECENYKFTATGSMELCGLFIERALSLIQHSGKIGCLSQMSILTGDRLSPFFKHLVSNGFIDDIFSFINERFIFPAVVHNLQFCVLAMGKDDSIKGKKIKSAFYTWDIKKLQRSLENFNDGILDDEFADREMKEGGSIMEISPEDFRLINPNSFTCPIFRRNRDMQLIKKLYQNAHILVKKDDSGRIIQNEWGIKFTRLLDGSGDSGLFKTKEQIASVGAKPLIPGIEGGIWQNDAGVRFLPLYGGSSIWYYDHRYYEVSPKKEKGKKRKANYLHVTENQHQNPNYFHVPMYWVEDKDAFKNLPLDWKFDWFFGYRNISSLMGQRTFIIAPIPKAPAVHSLPVITFSEFKKKVICFLANLASLIFDYIVRNKISGNNMTFFVIEQIPVINEDKYSKLILDEIQKRVIELVYTANDMKPFAMDFGLQIMQPPYSWDTDRRKELIAELDAIFALLYGLSKDDLIYILHTFYTLEKYELTRYGEFLTKMMVLKAYDKLSVLISK